MRMRTRDAQVLTPVRFYESSSRSIWDKCRSTYQNKEMGANEAARRTSMRHAYVHPSHRLCESFSCSICKAKAARTRIESMNRGKTYVEKGCYTECLYVLSTWLLRAILVFSLDQLYSKGQHIPEQTDGETAKSTVSL